VTRVTRVSIGIMVDAPRRSTRARKKVEAFNGAVPPANAGSKRKSGAKTKQANGKKAAHEDTEVG
jgi:hypothetical protein